MRGATQCARRLKRLFRSLRTKLGKVSRLPVGDPVTQLILGIFSRDMPEAKAREALDRLRNMVVDFNELRVIAPLELTEVLGDYPDARLKSEDVSRALNSIFAREHVVALERVAKLPKKEMLNFLQEIDGLDAYSRARVRLLGFELHAIPLDEAMWAYARQTQIVDGRCSLEQAQGFLERQIAEEDAVEFFALFRKQAWAEMGPLVRKGDVKRIRSAPPDRTTSNMLQVVSQAATEAAKHPAPGPTAELEESAASSGGASAKASARTPGRSAAAKPKKAAPQKKKPARKAKPASKVRKKAPAKPKRKATSAKSSARKRTARRAAARTRSRAKSRRKTARTKSA